MYIVAGLGNPGKNYSGTRHNVGFMAADYFAKANGVKLNKIKFKSLYNETIIAGEKVIIMKPQTYMNKSGEAIQEIKRYYNVPIENVIVIQDDLDIPFNSIRIKRKGSAGSHNGLKSIIYLLEDENFPRIRIGIGNPRAGQDIVDFVMECFSKDEKAEIDDTIEVVSDAIECIISDDIDLSMNKYNR